MGRFTEQIETLRASQKSASDAINAKLTGGGDSLYKISELADKIREIEVGPENPILIIQAVINQGAESGYYALEFNIRKEGDTTYSQRVEVTMTVDEEVSIELTGGFGTYLIYPSILMQDTRYHAHAVVTEKKEYHVRAEDFIYNDTHTMAPVK